MKSIRQRRFTILPALYLLALSACIGESEPVYTDDTSPSLKTTKLSIRLPELKNGLTRAVAGDFDNIHHLWILIAEGEDIVWRMGIDINTFDPESNNPIAGADNESGVTFLENESGYVVEYSNEWLEAEGIEGSTSNFIVVANYEANSETTGLLALPDDVPISEVTYVSQLRALRDWGTAGLVNENRKMMYGESGSDSSPAKTIELKRTAAMITLVIDGSGLLPNIEIIPVVVSLHNVPRYGYIGQDNITTTEPGGTVQLSNIVRPNGDITDAISPNGKILYVESSPHWGTVTRAGGVGTPVVGGHYPEITPGSEIFNYNFPEDEISPLFMYENYHGGDAFGAAGATQVNKRPAACGAATNEATIDQYAEACSYLQLLARYRDENATPAQYGEITYRVFLGADEVRNFDVMRNHYYRVTLNLSGNGRGEGNVSWRLDANLNTLEISDTDFPLNNAGQEIYITAPGDETGSNFNINYQGNNHSQANAGRGAWIYFNYGGSWRTIDDLDGSGKGKMTLPGTAYFYIQPMIRDLTWFGEGHVRQITFNLEQNNSAVTTPWITITQYEPVTIHLSDYAGNEEIETRVAELGWNMSGTLYLDRVDSPPMPWGFPGTAITAGNVTSSGLANGENLMLNYGATAGTYIPFGDANGGSAVMKAAFMKYYQRTTPPANSLSTNPTFANIRDYNVVPAGYPSFFLPSVAQWELLNMLNEENPLDTEEGHGLPQFQNYWTSDADTETGGGANNAYAFRMDGPVTPGGPRSIPRTTPTAYRLMYYMP